MAPTLANQEDRPRQQNVADPNAPFVVRASRPVLTTREPILDVQAVPTCVPAQLTAFESAAQSIGQQHTLRVSIVNRQEACRLGGFPSVSLIDPSGAVLGNVELHRVSHQAILASLHPPATSIADAGVPDTAPSPQVLLAARGEADFELGWSSGEGCAQVSRIAVAAPGTTESILLGRLLQICGKTLFITAVSPPENFNP